MEDGATTQSRPHTEEQTSRHKWNKGTRAGTKAHMFVWCVVQWYSDTVSRFVLVVACLMVWAY